MRVPCLMQFVIQHKMLGHATHATPTIYRLAASAPLLALIVPLWLAAYLELRPLALSNGRIGQLPIVRYNLFFP